MDSNNSFRELREMCKSFLHKVAKVDQGGHCHPNFMLDISMYTLFLSIGEVMR